MEAGIHTVEGLAHASKKALKDIKGLSEMKVEKLKVAGAYKQSNLLFFLSLSLAVPVKAAERGAKSKTQQRTRG